MYFTNNHISNKNMFLIYVLVQCYSNTCNKQNQGERKTKNFPLRTHSIVSECFAPHQFVISKWKKNNKKRLNEVLMKFARYLTRNMLKTGFSVNVNLVKIRDKGKWIQHCLWIYLALGFCLPKCKYTLKITIIYNIICLLTHSFITRTMFSFTIILIQYTLRWCV